MILLIDVGNTRIKWGFLKNKKFIFSKATLYKNHPLFEIFEKCWDKIPALEGVWISNVGGSALGNSLKKWIKKRWNITPHFLISQKKWQGLTLAYHDAETFGYDRYAALLKLVAEKHAPFLMIGCGSAITVDTVNPKGIHQGSLIAPGLFLQREVMGKLSNCYVKPSDPWPKKLTWGKSTLEAIHQGILQSNIEFLNAHIVKFKKKYKGEVVISGADAKILIPFLKEKVLHRPNLVLEGLGWVANSS